ncbi:MAG: Hsp20/alpha crystallin family protein [Deltaproteobacteria bacterium]|nr:MAG: Hsp20/alpha crystallin family protein [Deltaproteobacteria bacterium]
MKWFDDDIEKEFERMRQRMESMLGSLSRPGSATLCGTTGWRPSLDLYETPEEFVVLMDLAGVQPKDVEVIVERQVVRISGNRCRPGDDNVTRVHHMEIDFGPFNHGVRLPGPVDPDAASSNYRDGFLLVRLPKEGRTATSVAITVAE